MDYTKDTLSLGDGRMCEDKCAVQEPNYEGVPADHKMQHSRDHKGSQDEISLLGSSLPVQGTHASIKEQLSNLGTDSLVHAGFGIEANLMTENMYQQRAESAAQFMRSYIYGEDNKTLRNTDEIVKQKTNDRDTSFYYNEDRLTSENMNTEVGDCLGRSHHNAVNEMRSLSALELGKDDKVITPGCESYESVVSDFLPATPQAKDQQCLDIPVERRLQYNQTAQGKTFQYQGTHEDCAGYSQHPFHFAEMNFHRPEHFIDTKQAQNLLYQEGFAKPESYFSNINKVGFGNGSKDVHRALGHINNDFTRRMESGAAAVLASLQGTDVVAAVGTEHSRVREVEQSDALESFAKFAEGRSKYINREISDKPLLPKTNDLTEVHLQNNNDEATLGNLNLQPELKRGQEYSSLIKDIAKTEAAEFSDSSLTDDELTLPGEPDKHNTVDKSSSATHTRSVSECKTEDEEIEETDKDTVGLSVAKGKNRPMDEDAASVQSIESPPSPPIGTRRRFHCKICNRSWKFRKGLNKHLKTHKGAVKKFICSICNSSYVSRNLLEKHLIEHSDVDQFPCQECSTTFSSIDDLKRHRRIHASAREFPCTQCSYKAKHQKGLTKHMLVHSATKVYKCHICKFSSKRNYSLQRHMKTAHSSTLIFECSVCSFKTSTDESFKTHVVMHLSTRTMSCISCGALVKKRVNLTEHLLTHYADTSNTCKYCGETFTSGHEYMLHLLGHKDSGTGSHDEPNQTSGFELGTSSLLNGSADSAPGTFGFLARKSKIIMSTPMMEEKLSQMSTVASRLADMTKVVTLLNEKAKVMYQLAEISTLATELAVISGNVLQSYKNTYGVTVGSSSSVNKTPVVSNVSEDSSFMDDDYEMSSMMNLPAAKIKEELFDNMFASTEAGMQIQVDFNGEPVSCVQKEDTFREDNLSKSRGDKHLKCNRCHLTFTDTRSLKRHLMAHDDIRPYSCDKCGQSFRRNEHLKKHMVTHSDERPFVCKDCPYAAKTEHRLKIHILCHSQTKAYSCQHCTYTARTNYELNHHMKRHEPRSCSQCNFICYSRTEMKKHVFTHSSFDCNECEFTTSDRAEYNKHMKRHSIVQHLCCELCGYSCDTMKKFKYHKLRHENKTPYQCSDCDYKCSSRASYDCHRLKHAGLKPYLCSFCGAAFRKTSHLNQHLLIHKDEKSFRCAECGYSCRTKHNLKEHEMTHSGEKPFTCKYCSFSCRRNKALQLHMLKHESPSMMIPHLQMPTLQFPHLQMPLHMSMIPSGP